MNPQPPTIKIEGLPEGLEAYKFGVATEEEFELVGATIYKGKREGAASGVIIRPAAGFTFQPAQAFDIRNFQVVPGKEGTYMVVKVLPPTPVTVTLKVAVSNSFDQGILDSVLEGLKGLPGFVSLDRV